MGAYVLRSTNAHFKLWDEGVQDSFHENLSQASQNQVPNISLDCNCIDTPLGCSISSPTSQCAGNEMAYSHTCTPNQGCDGRPASSCQFDQDCCKNYYKEGCGINTIPISGIPAGTAPSSTIGLPSSGSNCYISTTGCYYGQRAWGTQCSGLPIVCCPEPDNSCNATCTGVTLDVNSALPCPNQAPATGTLHASAPTTYVSTENKSDCTALQTIANCDCTNPSAGACQTYCSCTYCGEPSTLPAGTTTASCQMYCNQAAGFFLDPTGTSCVNEIPVASILECASGACSYPQLCSSTVKSNCYTTVSGVACPPGSSGYSTCINYFNYEDITICPSMPGVAVTAASMQLISPANGGCGDAESCDTAAAGQSCTPPGIPNSMCRIALTVTTVNTSP